MTLSDSLTLHAIVATDENRVIGNKGELPWHLPEDLKYFSQQTKGHTVLMGRKTYDSLPERYKPLPGRLNIVISRNEPLTAPPQGVLYFKSPEDFFQAVETQKIKLESPKIWLIGGAQLYKQLIPYCTELHLTKVPGTHEGDTWLEEYESNMRLTKTILGEHCSWEIYLNK